MICIHKYNVSAITKFERTYKMASNMTLLLVFTPCVLPFYFVLGMWPGEHRIDGTSCYSCHQVLKDKLLT